MANAGNGVPVLFVPNFYGIRNRRKILDKLLAGIDVSVELEFNGIELSSEDLRVLSMITPIISRINTLGAGYDWLPGDAPNQKYSSNKITSRSGHTIGLKAAEMVWRNASHFWSGGPKPKNHYVAASGYCSRDVIYREDCVEIGCQTISRLEVETAARHFGWEPNVFEG